MATLSQTEANRCNAQHSTGPRTTEGRAASSMNALKSGIDAQSAVIPGEDAAALAALTEQLYQDCQPQTTIESLLVDNIIRASWRLRRFDRIDAELLIHTMEDTHYPSPNAPAGKAFHQSSNTQSRLQRRINDTSRLQREAIKDLHRIQAERPQPQPQPPAPQTTETEFPTAPIGFVTQTPVLERPPVPAAVRQPQAFSRHPAPASGPRHPAPGIRPSDPRGPSEMRAAVTLPE